MLKTYIAAGWLGLLLATVARADLKTYDIDLAYQREVYGALSSLMVEDPAVAAQGATYGRVRLLPTGQIVVDAAPETHRQIEQLLADMSARQVEEPPRAALRYWVLLGSRVPQANGDLPSALSGVLDEVERTHGDLMFDVLGTATLATESGQWGEVESRPLTVRQRVYVQGDTASAEVELRYVYVAPNASPISQPYAAQIKLNVTLERGEFLVLGESTVRGQGLDGTLFYIVHWPADE